MNRLHCVLAALIGGMVALMAPMVVAEVAEPMADIVHGDRADVRVADGGEVRVVPLKQGKWAHLGEFTMEAGARFSPESRTEEEYLYVLRGSAVLAVDDRRFLVGPRMGVYLPSGAEVTWSNGPEELVAVQLFAGPSPTMNHEDWNVEEDDAPWPRPRIKPRPKPSEFSAR